MKRGTEGLRLDAEAFDAVARKRRFQRQTVDIARRVLVDGEDPRDLAVGYGLSVSRIYAIAEQVHGAVKARHLPPGWIEVTIAGPEALIRQFQSMVAEVEKTQRGRTRLESDNLVGE